MSQSFRKSPKDLSFIPFAFPEPSEREGKPGEALSLFLKFTGCQNPCCASQSPLPVV